MPANFCVGPKSYGIGFPLEGWSLTVPVPEFPNLVVLRIFGFNDCPSLPGASVDPTRVVDYFAIAIFASPKR